MLRVLLFLLILGFSIQTSNASGYGPDDCLRLETEQCPLDFLRTTLCMVNQPICTYNPSTNLYSLNTGLFVSLYGSIVDFDFHDMFEYAICDSSPQSCELDLLNVNGLTIYNNSLAKRDDSRVCQITPEACTGYSQH